MDKILKASIASLFFTVILYGIFVLFDMLLNCIIQLFKEFNFGPEFFLLGIVWLIGTIWITVCTWDD